jgi:hypothetical protein
MALPRQVAQRIKEVEDIERQLNGETQQPEPSAEVEAEEVEVVEQPEPEAELTQEPETSEVEEATKPEPEPTVDKDDAKVWEQRYKTLKGMYDKDVPALHSEVKDLKAELSTLSKSIKQQETLDAKRFVTDEDVENFGEDMVDFQRRVASEVAAEYEVQINSLKEELAELKGTTEKRVAETSFESKLHRLVPDFADLNANPKWIEWLDEVDPVLRAPRRTVAQQAYANGDAEGVAYYVDMFKNLNAPVEPAPKAETKQELERQIQPTRTASTNPTSQKGKTYTSAQVTSMFKKIATLNSTGKIDEANKLEAEIDSAYMQGRVVG